MREMKDSGIEWIGEIPKDWTIKKLKNIKDNKKNAIIDGPFGTAISTNDYVDEGVPLVRITNLSGDYVSNDNLVFITNEHAKRLSRSEFVKNDIIVAKTGATIGKCAINNSIERGILSSSCVKISVANNKTNYKYIYYYFCSNCFLEEIKKACNGSTRDTINLVPFNNISCPVPPFQEQSRIASFLDSKCSEIDSLHSDIEEEIETLKEYKKSVITEAVTKGLNPDVEMKDSEIEWIGEIAINAELIKLKHYSYMKGRIGWQGLKSSDFVDEGPYCVTGTDFINGKVNWNTCYHVSNERYKMDSNIQIKVGDLLMTKDGTIGKLAIIDELPDKACLNSHLLIIRPLKNKYYNKYLYYIMKSHIFSKYYTIVSHGTTMDSLSQEKTEEFIVPIFSIKEQLKIINYLDSKCFEIDSIIESKQQQLETLEQYKKSLIYEYVTGKKEVPYNA